MSSAEVLTQAAPETSPEGLEFHRSVSRILPLPETSSAPAFDESDYFATPILAGIMRERPGSNLEPESLVTDDELAMARFRRESPIFAELLTTRPMIPATEFENPVAKAREAVEQAMPPQPPQPPVVGWFEPRSDHRADPYAVPDAMFRANRGELSLPQAPKVPSARWGERPVRASTVAVWAYERDLHIDADTIPNLKPVRHIRAMHTQPMPTIAAQPKPERPSMLQRASQKIANGWKRLTRLAQPKPLITNL